jgi:nucleotide-binding universal stress UspA family protein
LPDRGGGGRPPGDPPPTTRPVIVGADDSPGSDAALAFACEEAASRETAVTAVHTWSEVLLDGRMRTHPFALGSAEVGRHESRTLAEQVAGWQEKFPDVEISRVVRRGHPVMTLLEYGERAQWIVVGSREIGGDRLDLLLGSTSQAPVQHAPCRCPSCDRASCKTAGPRAPLFRSRQRSA